MRVSAALLLLVVGFTSAFVSGPQGYVAQKNGQAIRRSMSAVSAVSAEVNGAQTQATGSTSTSASAPNLNIRLNVNEKARTVTSVCTSGTLCTSSSHEGIEGAPFGSYVDYVLDDDGNPVLLMNEMSMHTVNIRENAINNPNTSGSGLVTLFTQLAGTGQDVSRCSLTGTIVQIDPKTAPDMDTIRMRYSIAHAYADQVMDSPKFHFYRLVPTKIYFVGGFGVLAKWVDPVDYQHSTPDILAQEAADICARVNRDHGEDLRLVARHLLQVQAELEKVRLTSVDRLGMDLRVTSQKGARRNKLITDEFRVGFRIPVISVEDAKSEILKVFQEAWEKGNGYVWETDEDLPGSDIPIAKIAEDSLE